MGLKDLYKSARNIVKLAVKPSWKEFNLLMRVVLLGVTIVGIYGFIIQMLAFGFLSIPIQNIPQQAVAAGVGGLIVFAAVLYFYGNKRGWWS